MVFPETLLNVSWSIQYIPNERCRDQTLHDLLSATSVSRAASKLDELSSQCYRYLQERLQSEPEDDLNNDFDRTGQLNECTVTRIASKAARSTNTVGLLIQSRHQRVAYLVVLLARSNASANDCPVVAVLYKSSQKNLRHIKGWLEDEFSLPPSRPLDMLPRTIASVCSRYVSATMQMSRTGEALWTATIKQIIGTLRLTITFDSSERGPAPKLRSMEVDVPADSIVLIQQKLAEGDNTSEQAFLDGLSKALYERTGLKLPLTGEEKSRTADDDEAVLQEDPMKVTKITCAAFAISADGRIKLAGTPVERAEQVGYPAKLVTDAHYDCLRRICKEAEARSSGDAD